MDRLILQPGAIPLDTDGGSIQRNAMTALGYLTQMIMGQSTIVDGLACSPTVPASMTVNIGQGSIMSLQTIDATAFGSLASDSNPLVKIGVNAEGVTPFTLTAPGTSGQSINYLIEATFQEADGTPVVLPYYNPANPAQPYSGPNNTGVAQNTVRAQKVELQLKAGAAANTGTQTTPAVDGGWVGLYVITVNFGMSSVTAGTISVHPSAPFMPWKLSTLHPHLAHGQCRLKVASATQISLMPYDGSNLIIQGVQWQIPSGGVTISNSGLAATTVYYVYATMVNGQMALALSTTGHATDTSVGNTGVEIKSGDNSYTLVGMVYTNASSQFADTTAWRGCLNWFNRRPIVATNGLSNKAISVTAGVEADPAGRSVFLCWGGQYTMADGIGGVANNTAAASSGAYIGFDVTSGTGGGFGASNYVPAANATVSIASQTDASLSEGAHFATILVANTAGIATYTYGYRVLNEG